MKRKVLFLLGIFLLILPIGVRAAASNEGYTSMNLTEVFKEEGIEISIDDYKENDDQVTIYMFRGNGCSYCRAFLYYLNDFLEKEGPLIKLRAYEVWYDPNNGELMDKVQAFTGEKAGGVPYIIIGEKVFGGYNPAFDEGLNKAIKDEFKLAADERYDVFEAMDNGGEKTKKVSDKMLIYWIIGSVGIAFIIIVILNIAIYRKLDNKLNKICDQLNIERKLSNKEVFALDNEENNSKKKKKK